MKNHLWKILLGHSSCKFQLISSWQNTFRTISQQVKKSLGYVAMQLSAPPTKIVKELHDDWTCTISHSLQKTLRERDEVQDVNKVQSQQKGNKYCYTIQMTSVEWRKIFQKKTTILSVVSLPISFA